MRVNLVTKDQSVLDSEGPFEIIGDLWTLMYLQCNRQDNWNLKVSRKNLEDFQNRVFCIILSIFAHFQQKNAQKQRFLAKIAIFKVLKILPANFYLTIITWDSFEIHQSSQITNNLKRSLWAQNWLVFCCEDFNFWTWNPPI